MNAACIRNFSCDDDPEDMGKVCYNSSLRYLSIQNAMIHIKNLGTGTAEPGGKAPQFSRKNKDLLRGEPL